MEDSKKHCDLLVSVCDVAIPEFLLRVLAPIDNPTLLCSVVTFTFSQKELNAAATQTTCFIWSIANLQNESGTASLL